METTVPTSGILVCTEWSPDLVPIVCVPLKYLLLDSCIHLCNYSNFHYHPSSPLVSKYLSYSGALHCVAYWSVRVPCPPPGWREFTGEKAIALRKVTAPPPTAVRAPCPPPTVLCYWGSQAGQGATAAVIRGCSGCRSALALALPSLYPVPLEHWGL